MKDAAQADLLGTLEKVAQIGYRGVEFAGYFGTPAPKLAETLARVGLTPIGSHVPHATLVGDFDGAVAFSLGIGNHTVVCTGFPQELRASADGWRKIAEALNELGYKLAEHDIACGYQNHGFEFETYDGESALQILMDNTDPDAVFLELDAFWAELRQASAVDVIRRFPGRCTLLHLGDMKRRGDEANTEVGSGVLDVPGIVREALHGGAQWIIVKQVNFEIDPFESAQKSFAYLKSLTPA